MGALLHEATPWSILPFVLLLLAIALGPLAFPRWWERHYPKLSLALASVTILYYLVGLHQSGRVLHVGREYISFIVLIGSLFVVSGGVHIGVKGEATPAINLLYLFIGAVVSNLLGTTGASMLLIRPWIRMNKYRITSHHIVFFIFIVSNVGGCLTPIGDPPLFLGYLKGVPFWWILQHAWPMWLVAILWLLGVFYVLDSLNYRRAPKAVRAESQQQPEQWRFDGLGNLLFIAMILGAVFIERPALLREGVMLAAAILSYLTTKKAIHESNHFNFHPIREVAVLFVGIFATMMPALDWLETHAGEFTTPSPGMFYWGSGILSSFLDNAPTYLAFLSAAFGLFGDPQNIHEIQRATANLDHIQTACLIANHGLYLLAISIGAVFFGANTYIGNGPNFLVKSIADHQKVRAPTFFGFIFKYTLPYMAPLLILIWLLFFRT